MQQKPQGFLDTHVKAMFIKPPKAYNLQAP